MPYITCRQKKNRHKVHVTVCEQCKGMTCPDYSRYLQLSLFPCAIPDEKIRLKFQPKPGSGDHGPASKSPEQLSWLEKPEPLDDYPVLPK